MNNIIGGRLIVSFCIPAFNNAEAVAKTVQSLLISDDTRFEVVVSDDASTDNTQEVLSQIHDPRFKYYRNDKNLGAHKNWERALSLGKGEYLFLCMMRDRMYGDKIPKLIEILEYAHKNNITLLYDGYDKTKAFQVYEGINAMIRFLKTCHPTATIFDREIFQSIPGRTRYFEISDMFPENYVRRDCLLQGKGAVIVSGVYSREGDFYNYNKPSTVEYGKNIFDMYYAPRRKTIQAFELIDMVAIDAQGVFTKHEINRYFKATFNDLMYAVSTDWKGWCERKDQEYYGQKVRHVGMIEIISNILKAYHDTKAHLKDKGIFTVSKQMSMYLCLMKYLMYKPIRWIAKRILKYMGVVKL